MYKNKGKFFIVLFSLLLVLCGCGKSNVKDTNKSISNNPTNDEITNSSSPETNVYLPEGEKLSSAEFADGNSIDISTNYDNNEELDILIWENDTDYYLYYQDSDTSYFVQTYSGKVYCDANLDFSSEDLLHYYSEEIDRISKIYDEINDIKSSFSFSPEDYVKTNSGVRDITMSAYSNQRYYDTDDERVEDKAYCVLNVDNNSEKIVAVDSFVNGKYLSFTIGNKTFYSQPGDGYIESTSNVNSYLDKIENKVQEVRNYILDSGKELNKDDKAE